MRAAGGGVADRVEIEQSGGVRTIWLNRPDRRNALSLALVDDLRVSLAAAAADSAVRAVVLAGRGAGFCAGGDLADGLAGDGFAAGHASRGQFASLLQEIAALRVPVVAAVHGDALGGGCGLVAACDLAVADADARFGTPEIKIGLFPWMILVALRRGVPRKALFELVATGDRIGAERAAQIGLINRVAPAGTWLAAAQALAAQVGGQSGWAMANGKSAFYQVEELAMSHAYAAMQSQLSLNLLTEDAMEGVAAFLQKRAPTWKDR
jgi:enoyl-CoA hydratase